MRSSACRGAWGLVFGLAGPCALVLGCGARTPLDVPGPPLPAPAPRAADASAASVADASEAGSLGPACSYGGEPGAPWPMGGRCPDQSGVTPVVASSSGTMAFSLSLGKMISASPVVAADGTIYVGALDGTLFAVTHGGTIAWERQVGQGIAQPAAVGAAGIVYVTSTMSGPGAALFSVSPSGDIRWSAPIPLEGAMPFGPPTIGPEGHVYVSSAAGLQAFSPSGARLWTFDMDGVAGIYPPAVSTDGTVYYAPLTSPAAGPSFVALTSAGATVWQTSGGEGVTGGVMLGPDGSVYACGADNSNTDILFGVAPGGDLAWMDTFVGGSGCATAPSLAFGGQGVIFPMAFRLMSSTAAGAQNWAFDWPPASAPPSAVAVGGDGTIYVGLSDAVRAYTPSGMPLWTVPTGSPVAAPAIGADGTLYAAVQDGRLLAFGP